MSLKMDYNQVLEHVQMNNIVLAAAGDGVVSGLDVTEKGTPDMSVDVAAGSCKIGGTKYTESGTVNLAISAADATHARKDLVIYDVATTNPLVVTGTPATPPVPPDITAGDILLAIVDVAANETTITNSEITDCIVEITKLDELAAPSDNTNLNSSISAHGLLKKLPNNSAQYLNGVGTWATPAGAGDMTKAVYDTGDNGIVDNAEKVDGKTVGNATGNVPVSNGTVCTNLRSNFSTYADEADAVTWAGVTGKPSTFPPEAHSATLITSGILAVARGGTGVSGDTYDADKVDGCHAGVDAGKVWKIPTPPGCTAMGVNPSGDVFMLAVGTSGYQLTSQGNTTSPIWSAASDLVFSDTHCPKCGQEFKDGEILVLYLIGHNEIGDILTIPMHLSCANAPKKTVALKRKVMEDRYILDEDTGELKIHRVQKTTEKTVAKHKLKEGYALLGVTGRVIKIDRDGKRGTVEYNLSEALETVEETISEIIYEDVEYYL